MSEVKIHYDEIRCPKCGTVQSAIVAHTWPHWSYVHTCVGCGYIIMESEWEVVDE